MYNGQLEIYWIKGNSSTDIREAVDQAVEGPYHIVVSPELLPAVVGEDLDGGLGLLCYNRYICVEYYLVL